MRNRTFRAVRPESSVSAETLLYLAIQNVPMEDPEMGWSLTLHGEKILSLVCRKADRKLKARKQNIFALLKRNVYFLLFLRTRYFFFFSGL